jgi:hypothetical protein
MCAGFRRKIREDLGLVKINDENIKISGRRQIDTIRRHKIRAENIYSSHSARNRHDDVLIFEPEYSRFELPSDWLMIGVPF